MNNFKHKKYTRMSVFYPFKKYIICYKKLSLLKYNSKII